MDLIVLSVYLGFISIIFTVLRIAELRGWRAHNSNQAFMLATTIGKLKKNRLFMTLPLGYVATSVPLAFVLVSVWADYVPRDFGMLSAALGLMLLFVIMLRRNTISIVAQAVSYITGAFAIYLETKYFGSRGPITNGIEIAFFVGLVVSISIVIRYDKKTDFSTTPTDYLVIITVLFAGYLLNSLPEKTFLGIMAVKLVILFYACELLFSRMKNKWHVLNVSSIVTLTILAMRGLT
jgi:UDP-GlcNAc:undecaprenyl-phosphate GlcNAc-1-phosphate transferase